MEIIFLHEPDTQLFPRFLSAKHLRNLLAITLPVN